MPTCQGIHVLLPFILYHVPSKLDEAIMKTKTSDKDVARLRSRDSFGETLSITRTRTINYLPCTEVFVIRTLYGDPRRLKPSMHTKLDSSNEISHQEPKPDGLEVFILSASALHAYNAFITSTTTLTSLDDTLGRRATTITHL